VDRVGLGLSIACSRVLRLFRLLLLLLLRKCLLRRLLTLLSLHLLLVAQEYLALRLGLRWLLGVARRRKHKVVLVLRFRNLLLAESLVVRA